MSTFGAFGKIPDLGDFFRHNLSPKFVQPYDEWLQSAMIAGRETLGPHWEEAYMSAPIWRFTLTPGMAGPQAMSGILMASVDRVGRQYPLTLVAPHAAQNPALVHFANRTVFEQLEDIALQMLDDTGRRDALLAALETVQLIVPEGAAMASVPYVGPLPAAQVLAAEAVTRTQGEGAIWSTMMASDHRLMTSKTLPQGAEMRALFDLNAPLWTGGGGLF